MPAGIQVFNADGSVQFDSTNRLTRILTLVDTGGAAGSVNTGATGAVAVVAQPSNVNNVQPNVSVAGGNVSWNFPSGTADNTRLLLMEY